MCNFEIDALPPEHSSQRLLLRRCVLCARARVLSRYAEESRRRCALGRAVGVWGAVCGTLPDSLARARDFSAFFCGRAVGEHVLNTF